MPGFQAKQWVCHSGADAGRGTGLRGQRQRTFSLTCLMSRLFILNPKSQRADTEGDAGEWCTHSGFRSQLRNPEFRKSQTLKWVASKSANNSPRRGFYLYHPGHSAPEGNTTYTFQGQALLKHPWRGSPEQKPLLTSWAEMQGNHGEFPTNTICLLFLYYISLRWIFSWVHFISHPN